MNSTRSIGMRWWRLFTAAAGLLLSASAPPATPGPRLYVLDCGEAAFTDLGPFADDGAYDGRSGKLQATCVLIRHAKGDLLWDAGFPDRFAGQPEGVQRPLYRVTVRRPLGAQLAELGLGFDDIDYFAFSHGHADHLGNAPELRAATWLVNRRELVWLQGQPAPPRTDPSLVAGFDAHRAVMLEGDHDVFGDGRVRILSTPGHTPGHQSLMVKLARAGVVIVSGDLFHTHANREFGRVPRINVDRAATRAAMARIETLLRQTRGRLLIQHERSGVPLAPAYVD